MMRGYLTLTLELADELRGYDIYAFEIINVLNKKSDTDQISASDFLHLYIHRKVLLYMYGFGCFNSLWSIILAIIRPLHFVRSASPKR